MVMGRNFALILIVLFAGNACADSFYKWIDEKGVTHYSEAPPPTGQSETINMELAPATEAAPPAPKFEYTPAKSSKSVVIYTAQWCGICTSAKRYMREHSIRFTEYDIEKSAKGQADYRRMNGQGVPILMVDGKRMNGFTPAGLEAMLK
jgi:glutaredoxin